MFFHHVGEYWTTHLLQTDLTLMFAWTNAGFLTLVLFLCFAGFMGISHGSICHELLNTFVVSYTSKVFLNKKRLLFSAMRSTSRLRGSRDLYICHL